MIPADAKIMEVRRIYESEADGDCMDFAEGALFMMVGKPMGVPNSFGAPAYDACHTVAMTPDAVEQFERMGWSPEFTLWVPQYDCRPIDDEMDAKLRAMVALSGEQPVIL